ncbi:MAG: hypothetical protein RRY40_02660, partial [Oscillospiraceae bacterium]
HRNCGRLMGNLRVDAVLAVGNLGSFIVEGAEKVPLARHFKTKDELYEFLKLYPKEKDILWFKASRGERLEEVLEKLV